MKAIEIKKKFVKEIMEDKVGVIAISNKSVKETYWYHIHDNEHIPEKGYDIAIHIRQ